MVKAARFSGLIGWVLGSAWLGPLVVAQEWEVFDMTNSPLPSTTVNALAEDPLGGVWIGTDWGLCHFDGGSAWDVYQMGNSGIPSNDVRALALDAQERLWVGTVSEGLVVWDGATWVTYNTGNSPIPENGVRDLFVDHRDWVWIATSGGLACYTGSEWRIYDESEQSYGGLIMNTGNTRSVAVRQDGLVCVGTFNGGLHFLSETSISFLTTFNDGFFDNTATDVLFDPVSGDRWISTPSAGLLRQQGPAVGGSWYQWNSSVGFPSNGVNCISMDGVGGVWAGSQFSGSIRVDGNNGFTSFTTANSDIPDNEVPSILAASDGSIWIGTVYGGLARYRPSTGLKEPGLVPAVRVFPNPASEQCTIELPEVSGPWSWEVIDMQGRRVAQGTAVVRVVIPLNAMASGGYQLNVDRGAERFRSRVVVQ